MLGALFESLLVKFYAFVQSDTAGDTLLYVSAFILASIFIVRYIEHCVTRKRRIALSLNHACPG